MLAVVYLTMRYAELLERLLKDNGIHLVTRVMGMLLIAISIELVATAVQAYVAGVVGDALTLTSGMPDGAVGSILGDDQRRP